MDQKYDDKGDRFQVELPSDYPDDITVVLNIPDQNGEINLETDLTSEEIEAALKVRPPFAPFKIISYFKVRDAEGELITEFDPPLELQLEYSREAWYESEKTDFWQEKRRPRVYYLEKIDESWADSWLEFPDDNITARPPEDEKTNGFINISIAELPDPRIGGC